MLAPSILRLKPDAAGRTPGTPKFGSAPEGGLSSELMIRITTHERSIRFAVHVQPRASRTELSGEHGDALKIRLAAPPVEGAANDELIRFLAKRLHVSSGAVRIVSGAHGRRKVVEIDGIAAEAIEQMLEAS
jgi:uncharacterized protein (TIGR00251 family)